MTKLSRRRWRPKVLVHGPESLAPAACQPASAGHDMGITRTDESGRACIITSHPAFSRLPPTTSLHVIRLPCAQPHDADDDAVAPPPFFTLSISHRGLLRTKSLAPSPPWGPCSRLFRRLGVPTDPAVIVDDTTPQPSSRLETIPPRDSVIRRTKPCLR